MKKTMWCSRCLCVLFVGSLLISVGACKKKEARVERAANVAVRTVEQREFKPFIEATGTLNAFEEVSIGAEIDGIVKSVRVDEGAGVAKGTLLALLDDAEYTQSVISAQAALRQSEATLANTGIELSRKEALYKEELVTRQQFDDVTTRFALTEADVERGKAALSIARQKLAKTHIYAPLSSKVKQKLVSAGDFVKNGTRLFSLIQPNPLKVLFSVSERDVGRIRIGQDVIVTVDAFPGQEFKGKVHVVFPSLEEKTRTLSIEALVPDSKGLLKPGLFARVTLYTGNPKETTVVPITALLYEADKVRVYIVEGERAKERSVKLGSKYGEMMEITEGVRAGESIVIAGQQGLSEGAKVSIQGAGSAGSGARKEASQGR